MYESPNSTPFVPLPRHIVTTRQYPALCTTCDGRGKRRDRSGFFATCQVCGGSGRITITETTTQPESES